MTNTYRIFFDDKPFIICNAISTAWQALAAAPDTVVYHEPDQLAIKQSIDSIETENIKAILLITNDTNQCWKEFQRFFTPITTGGGLVKNADGDVLFMFRRGRWDLPKGKQDDGESIEACALRELAEETGLRQVIIENYLCTTWHTYRQKNTYYLKTSVWFAMTATGNEALIPQAEEDITDIKWVSKAEIPLVMQNTFPTIKLVLKAAGL